MTTMDKFQILAMFLRSVILFFAPIYVGSLSEKMANNHSNDCHEIVRRARTGDQLAIAELLELYRNYLVLMARVHVDTNLQAKADPSDLVQETFLRAIRNFPQFRGETEAELIAWLRGILANTGAAMIRRYKATQSRNIGREQEFERQLNRSSMALGGLLAARDPTPSQIASRREDVVKLADALSLLPDNYREVLLLHHLEGLSLAEVAKRMANTIPAIKGLRTRAVVKLRMLLKEPT